MEDCLSILRVLLVEDEPLLAWELELALAEAGATVVGPASTLKMGLALAQQNAIAAAIIDFRLGSEEASPLAALLYERGIPFIIHTGHSTSGHSAWGSPPVVRKPASPDRVVRTLAQFLGEGEGYGATPALSSGRLG